MTHYLIRATRHFYAGAIHNGRVAYYGRHLDTSNAPLVAFPSREAARAAIAEIESAAFYYLGQGEYARPTLRAVPVTSAPAAVRNQVC